MNIEALRNYCLSLEGTGESFPFDNDTLVFKVYGKMFCLTSLKDPGSINLKCEPGRAQEHREQYACVLPGYHMNKKMWNTVILDGSISEKTIKEWIDHSYQEVLKGIPARLKSPSGPGRKK